MAEVEWGLRERLGFGAARDEVRAMASIFAGLAAGLAGLAAGLPLRPRPGRRRPRGWLPPATAGMASKRWGERFCLQYSGVWGGAFGAVVAFQLYEGWRRWEYLGFGVVVAAPALAYPLLRPGACDRGVAWHRRYIVKANAWVAIFSFIGNYWYTHYFYHVLKADYTMDAHRLNDVPVAMYLYTHAYFMTYHVLTNMALRRVRATYEPGWASRVFEAVVTCALAYTTAFMEALTISTFPYYRFEDRFSAWTLGSAFYGIYFIVSFPMHLRIDEDPRRKHTLAQVCLDSFASGMIVLCLLDFVRLALGVPLFAPH